MRRRDRDQLGRVIGLIRDVLGSNVVGAYLFGSATAGGLRPRSDLDVLAAVNRRLSDAEKQALVERILPISWQQTPEGMLRGIELTVVAQADVKPWRYPPRRDFQYGNWLRVALERGKPEPWAARTDPDLASLITQALAANHPLLGPPPADVFDPVPWPDVQDAIVADLDQWVANIDTDTRNGILALARIWSALATGELYPKDIAAAWALERLPDQHKPVLARARAIYLSGDDDHWDDLTQAIGRYVRYVVREIETAE